MPASETPLTGALPKDLSPWGMFQSADFLVKFVMLGLTFASLLTWTIALAKGWGLRAALVRIRRDLAIVAAASSLREAGQGLGDAQPASVNGLEAGGAGTLVAAAAEEVRQSSDISHADGIKERVASRLSRIEAQAGRAMAQGTGILATIGATAPFVGLFGTVWGIMNSFINISKQHMTNLAVVAPGIAEALLATALGLIVAIPAVVIYNTTLRAIATYRARYADCAAEVLRLASRDLDRALYPTRIADGRGAEEGSAGLVRWQRS